MAGIARRGAKTHPFEIPLQEHAAHDARIGAVRRRAKITHVIDGDLAFFGGQPAGGIAGANDPFRVRRLELGQNFAEGLGTRHEQTKYNDCCFTPSRRALKLLLRPKQFLL
jgi:hypothetical protein